MIDYVVSCSALLLPCVFGSGGDTGIVNPLRLRHAIQRTGGMDKIGLSVDSQSMKGRVMLFVLSRAPQIDCSDDW